MPVKSPLYDRDFFAWSLQQAELLRAERSCAPTSDIAEEIESMGRAEKCELDSRFSVFLLHLLKWRYQPEKRSPSWEASIRVQRNRLADHPDDNPSLKPSAEALASAYRDAALEAVAEMGLAGSASPKRAPDGRASLDGGFWGVTFLSPVQEAPGREFPRLAATGWARQVRHGAALAPPGNEASPLLALRTATFASDPRRRGPGTSGSSSTASADML